MEKINHDLQFSYEFAKIKSDFEKNMVIVNMICLAFQIGFLFGRITK